jgi:replicative DNA helicase
MTTQPKRPQRKDRHLSSAPVDSELVDPAGDGEQLHDVLAERSVLGGMLLLADAIADVMEILRAEDFSRPQHRTIFEAIVHLFDRGEPADAVTVTEVLLHRGELRQAGGTEYLYGLIHDVPTAANATHYADIVAEKATLRRLLRAGTRITQLGLVGAQTEEVAEAVDRAQAELDAVTRDGRATSGPVRFSDLHTREFVALDDLQAGRVEPGLMTGYLDLDELLGGLQPGQVVLVAARPGVGKSALGTDVARSVCVEQGLTSVIYSLEMTQHEIWTRMLAAEAKVRLKDLKTPGALQPHDQDKLFKARDRYDNGGPLFIDDTPSQTVAYMRSHARRLKKRHGLHLIVIDYLQLITPGRRAESRQVEVGEISRNVKLLAKELEVPVVAMSQLNRGAESRADKRPQLGDLRESGALEQDSDMVILINRPDAYDRDDPRAGEADFIVAKNRGGPTATITVAHQLHYGRFANLSQP